MKIKWKKRILCVIVGSMCFITSGCHSGNRKTDENYNKYEYEELSIMGKTDLEELEVDRLEVYQCGKKTEETGQKINNIGYMTKSYKNNGEIYGKGCYEKNGKVENAKLEGAKDAVFFKKIREYLIEKNRNEAYMIEDMHVVYGPEQVEDELLLVPMVEAELRGQSEETSEEIVYSVYTAAVYGCCTDEEP